MADNQQPNILFILTDEHKLSAAGCYGDTVCQTPNIDRLAQTGVRFETAYTSCPVCTPARGTIMTGLYPHAHGMCCNVEDLGCSVHEIVDRPALLSRRLLDAGYHCGYTGKWHLGSDRKVFYGAKNRPALPRDVGFEGHQFPAHGNGGFGYPEYQQYLQDHGWEHRLAHRDPRPYRAYLYGILEGTVESTVPWFLAEHTIGMIDRFAEEQQPFFIWHNFWGPHQPYYAPRSFYDLYKDVSIPEWPNYRFDSGSINRPFQVMRHTHADRMTWEDWAEGIRHYYAFATLIDQQIGRVLDHLDATGIRENTIIIFAADHGETLGTHGGLTNKGFHHFEEIQRIPFIVWMPERYYQGTRRPGDVVSDWVSILDLYPTILDLAGAEWDKSAVHGLSIEPLLRGEETEWRDKAFVEFFGVNSLVTTMISVRKGRFKYGWNCSNFDDLFDLESDPHEMRNLIDDPAYADLISEMRADLEQWMEETRFPGLDNYRRERMGKFPF